MDMTTFNTLLLTEDVKARWQKRTRKTFFTRQEQAKRENDKHAHNLSPPIVSLIWHGFLNLASPFRACQSASMPTRTQSVANEKSRSRAPFWSNNATERTPARMQDTGNEVKPTKSWLPTSSSHTAKFSTATASRPWDKDRDGFVLGEGAGVVVLDDRLH